MNNMKTYFKKNKQLSFIIIILFIITSFDITVTAIEKNKTNENKSELYETTSDMLYVGGTWYNNFTRIQDAIDNASTGDTVYVYNGTYHENLIINKPIYLMGENKNTTVIDGGGKGDTISVNSENVTLHGFTITNGKTDSRLDLFRAGVRVTSSNCVIQGNIIKDNQLGILGLRVTNLTIFRNQFYGNGVIFSPYENYERPKIFMKYFIHNISENIVNEKPLIYLLNQKNLELKDNVGQIIAVNCSNITIKELEITQSNTDSAILLAYCSNFIIEKSNISNNAGIWTFKSNNNIFRNNTFSNNFHGMTLDYGSNNNLIENNYITNNLYAGVMIEYYSINNYITKNDLINNTYSGYFTQAFRNKWNNNYYSDWIGLKYTRMRFLPKLILGRPLDLYPRMGVCFNIDWNPSETPFN